MYIFLSLFSVDGFYCAILLDIVLFCCCTSDNDVDSPSPDMGCHRTSSTLKKILSKSSSKDHVSLSSGDGALPFPDARIPREKNSNLARRPHGSSRGSAQKQCERKEKSKEVREAEEGATDFVE